MSRIRDFIRTSFTRLELRSKKPRRCPDYPSGASYDRKMGWFWIPFTVSSDPALEAYIGCQFDSATDLDDQEIEKKQARAQYFRRLCMIRTLSFPLDLIATEILLGRIFSKKRWDLQCALWQFLRYRSTIDQLMKAIKECG